MLNSIKTQGLRSILLVAFALIFAIPLLIFFRIVIHFGLLNQQITQISLAIYLAFSLLGYMIIRSIVDRIIDISAITEKIERDDFGKTETQEYNELSKITQTIQNLVSRIEKTTLQLGKSINELRESEEEFKILSISIPGMVYRGKSDWSIEIVSHCEEVCGYSSKELGYKETNWLTIIHPDDKEKVIEESSKLLEGSESISIVQEYRIKAKDGSIRWIRDHKTSFFTEDGVFRGIDGVIFDITELKKVEESLRQLTSLRTLTDVLKIFIGDALNNILTIVYSNTLMYQSYENIDQELRESLDTATKWLNSIIQGIRTYQNFSSLGKDSFGDTTSETLGSILEPLISGKPLKTYYGEEFEIPSNVKLKFIYDSKQRGALNLEELPYVLGSEDKIITAIQETLINAIESCEEGKEGEVVVSAMKEDDNIILNVSDNGVGMCPEELKKVQLPFYKIPCTKISTRLGIGAYIALQAMKYFGGDIHIKSEENVGTTTSLLYKPVMKRIRGDIILNDRE
ncbi:MAG TPA: PAS domain S-box protein [bacterium]|nr:PAS domain S-box protein [bacterium]